MSSLVNGLWAEAGPEFISPSHTFLSWYIRNSGLTLIQTEGMDNSPFTPVINENNLGFDFKAESLKLKQALIEGSKQLQLGRTIYTPEMEKIDSDSLWELVEEESSELVFRKYLETHFEFENGINPREIGLLPYLLLIRSHGDGFFENLELYRLNGGLSQLCMRMENVLSRDIKVNSLVRKIIRESKFTLTIESNGNSEVHANSFDSIILSSPPRLWDGGKLLNINLPSQYIPQMGDSIKILVRVPSDMNIKTGILPSSFLEKNTLVQAIWESGIGSNSKFKIMTIMCGGSAAEQLTRLGRDEAINILKKEISQYIPEFNSVAKGSFHFKDWGRRKLTQCGYGCPAPYELTDYRPELEDLLPENLYLCGEWYSWEMWGYMEGAIRSALTAVLKVCRKYGASIPRFLDEEII
jgi:monoamine oxidase